MTVCIAAPFVHNDATGFVLCADTRLSGTYSRDERGDKIQPLGRNWVAMVSGNDIALAIRVCRSWEKRIASSASVLTRQVIARILQDGLKEHTNPKSALYNPASQDEFLIAGFERSGLPVLFHSSLYGERSEVSESIGVFAIGSGAALAMGMLSQRRFHAGVGREKAIYLTYEAKKFSENADGVGEETQMMMHGHRPGLKEYADVQLMASYLSPESLVYLESVRQQCLLPPVPTISPFPDRFFDGDYPFSS